MGKRPCAPWPGQPERTLPPWHAGLGKGGPHEGGGHRRMAGWHRTQRLRERPVVPSGKPTWCGPLGSDALAIKFDLAFWPAAIANVPGLRARFCRAIPMVELGKRARAVSIGQRRPPLDGRMGPPRRERPQLVEPSWGLAWDIHPGEGPNPRHRRRPSHARRHPTRHAPVAALEL